MGIAVLGPLSIDGRSVPLGRRDRAVLAALAVLRGEEVRTERLYDVLWAGTPPASAAKVVQGCVVRLRKALGAGAIDTTTAGYRLAVTADEIDSYRFEAAVARGGRLLGDGAPDRAATVLVEALTLWHGAAFPDLEDWEPGRAEADRLTELRLRAEELYVEATIASGGHDTVLAKATRMVQDEPLRERRWMLLAHARYLTGRQADALEALRRLRRLLDDELGLDAGPEIDRLEQDILRRDPSLTPTAPVTSPVAACPYLGLLAYDVRDASTFFGRDDDVEACLRKLRDTGVLAVVGASGTGKSSLVRAGVAAALDDHERRVGVMTPGPHPLAALAAVVGPQHRVLVVDQCEEVFSQCLDADERRDFFTALLSWAASGRLVLSMRADHLSELAVHPDFARLVERGLYLLGPMGEDDLRSAIRRPASQAGLTVEPALVDLLVDEVADRPGALPMLSHSLSETWLRRVGGTLTVASYQESGGLRGAVAMSAEAVYAAGDAEHQAALRDVMLRLVRLGDDMVPLRARLSRRLLVHDLAHDDVVDQLVTARLVTSDAGDLEMAHEALVRGWPRLRGWLEEDVDGQRIRQHLTIAAEAWDAMGRPESELYRGARLVAASHWQQSTAHPLAEVERDFLRAGETLADSERLLARLRERRQARANRTLRGLLSLAGALLVCALVAGLLAVRQASNADRARAAAERASHDADRSAVVADSGRLGARALTTDDISLAMLLALEGVNIDDSEQSRTNLVAALMKRPELVLTGRERLGHLGGLAGGGVQGVLASSDGQNRVVFLTRSVQPAGRRRIGPWHRSGHDLRLAFNPSGSVLAAVPQLAEPDARSVSVSLIDPVTQQLRRRLTAPATGPADALDLAFSGDGRFLAGVFRRTRARRPGNVALVWDVRGGRARSVDLPAGPQGLAMDTHGRVLYTSWPLAAHAVATGRLLWRTALRGRASLAIDRAGTRLVLPLVDGVRDADVAVASASSGHLLRRLLGHTERASHVAFAPDGRTVSAAGEDGLVLTWDASTGALRNRMETGTVNGLAYSRFSSYVMTTSVDGAGRLWDIRGPIRFLPRIVEPRAAQDTTAGDVPAGDGRAVAFTWTRHDARHFLRLLDLDTVQGRTIAVPAALTPAAGAWREDREVFVSAGGRTLRLFDAVRGRQVLARRVGGSGVTSVVFAPGQRRLVLGSRDGEVTIRDATSLALEAPSVDVGGDVCCMAAGPGPRQVTVVSTRADRPPAGGPAPHDLVSVLDVGTARVVHRVPVGRDVLSVSTSSTTDEAAFGTAEGQLVTLDVTTGAERRQAGSGHEPGAVWTDFSSDGRRIVTTASDGSARLWDAARAHLLVTVRVPEQSPLTATFLAGDEVLVLSSRDGAVYQWDTSPTRAHDYACRIAGRTISRAEWAVYLGRRPYRPVCTFHNSFTSDPRRVEVGDVDSIGP